MLTGLHVEYRSKRLLEMSIPEIIHKIHDTILIIGFRKGVVICILRTNLYVKKIGRCVRPLLYVENEFLLGNVTVDEIWIQYYPQKQMIRRSGIFLKLTPKKAIGYNFGMHAN